MGSLILSTTIVRLRGALNLCQAIDDGGGGGQRPCGDHEQKVLRHLSKQWEAGQLPRELTLEGAEASFHVLHADGVAYVACCARQFRKDQAYAYLLDLHKEFSTVYPAAKVEAANRPYCFIKFDRFIQKTVRLYQTPQASQQVAHLRKELGEVKDIMQQSLEDVLGRGEKLETLQSHSAMLKHESGRYHKRTVQLNRWYWLRTYGKPAIAISGVLMLVCWRLGISPFFFL
eukprot:TRINITY_DN8462_c0_g1_i1.p1 TRINITY_DN8462_c0_g1~~TRINITY_DN8462_c0_g1_i1.p1  ORF type:complete len:268 (+),score=86.45 TRINITY_DN8462_c0_g1_i1:117-806(+)